ncbi:MAG: 4Fe-4S dicluster domain-containing protein [Candidatus Bathyarchaeota archaeon]|nr:MAG: 4Fe-4S dicluster domain-containing protein [Candidatus Bathyarchaeota archaeon]
MHNAEESIREAAKKLLSEKKVDLIVGHEQGTLPLRTTPCFIDKVEDVPKLVWNENCDANLSKYLIGRKERMGVVAKGCDARSIAVCTFEKQIVRDNVVIIGAPCSGLIDKKKVRTKLEGKELLEATIEDEQIQLKGEGFELVLPKKDFVCSSCLTCRHKTPPIYDVFAGTKVPEVEADEFSDVADLEAKSSKERWTHFKEALDKCIRCYACRDVCPLCYCKTCFVDQTMPIWFGKTTDLSDTMIYHLVRAFHVAGRCVDCGACSRACPMNINLRELMKKTEKIMKERYNYTAGLSLEKVPPLGEFKMDDSQEFIK